MTIKTYTALPDEAVKIRTEVFMDEQGFRQEFDETDKLAVHFVMFEDEKPIATCRVFKGETDGSYILGRLAVVKSCRGRSLGSELVKSAQEYVKTSGGKSISLHAQCAAERFYSALGFERFGEEDDDEGCPHIWMKKEL